MSPFPYGFDSCPKKTQNGADTSSKAKIGCEYSSTDATWKVEGRKRSLTAMDGSERGQNSSDHP